MDEKSNQKYQEATVLDPTGFSFVRAAEKGDVNFVVEKEEGSQEFVRVPHLASRPIVDSPGETKKNPVSEFLNYNPDYVYAEEVIDEDEDLYHRDAEDIALAKDKHKTYVQIAEEINRSAASFGYSGRIGLDLLSALSFSRFVHLEGSKEQVSALLGVLGCQRNIVAASEEAPISFSSVMLSCLALAKSKPNNPIFIYLDGISAENIVSFLRPIYGYIDNPNGENYLSSGGKTYAIPRNLYFLFSLAANGKLSALPRRYLRYVANLPLTLSPTEAKESESVSLSLPVLHVARLDLSSFQLKEESWKKIDKLAEGCEKANGYLLQNKIINRLENAANVYLASSYDEDDVLDQIIAKNLIQEAIISKSKKDLEASNLSEVLDTYFGADKMMGTRTIIKDYLKELEGE